MHSVTRWLDYFFIFGHFQQRKFAKKHKHFANLSTKFCQIPNYARKEFQKYFNTLANVAIFAKSGHTDSCSSRRSGKAVPNTKVWVLWQRREVVRVVDGGVRCTRVLQSSNSPRSLHIPLPFWQICTTRGAGPRKKNINYSNFWAQFLSLLIRFQRLLKSPPTPIISCVG